MSASAAAMPVENRGSYCPVVYIVDDEPSTRHSLRFLLEPLGLKTELFDSPQTFLASYALGAPGCMILDLRFRDTSGFDLLEHMRQREIDLPVLILTGFATVPLTVRAMQAGAFDLFEKPYVPQLLLECVQRALAKDRERRRERTEMQAAAERVADLTARQREVAAGVVCGKLNKEIAEELGLSEKTVEVHRRNVMKKTQVGSVAALVRIWDLSRKRHAK